MKLISDFQKKKMDRPSLQYIIFTPEFSTIIIYICDVLFPRTRESDYRGRLKWRAGHTHFARRSP